MRLPIRVRARAYSSSANLGPGFDILAVAHTAFFDEIEMEIDRGNGRVVIESVDGPYAPYVDRDANTAIAALRTMIGELGLEIDIRLRIWKGVPVAKGLGSSGATAAAAVRGLAEALRLRDLGALIRFAGAGEAVAAGEPHYDNVAASIVGGFVALLDRKTMSFRSWYPEAYLVVAVPRTPFVKGKTALMRSVIPRSVELSKVVVNATNLLKIVLGLEIGNLALVGEGMEDYIVEPARARYVPCYYEVRNAAKRCGALGVALSGAGPSIIALCSDRERAEIVARCMEDAYRECGTELEHLVIARPAPGAMARVVEGGGNAEHS